MTFKQFLVMLVLVNMSSPEQIQPDELSDITYNNYPATTDSTNGPCSIVREYNETGDYDNFLCESCGKSCHGSGQCAQLVQTFKNDGDVKWMRGCVCVGLKDKRTVNVEGNIIARDTTAPNQPMGH